MRDAAAAVETVALADRVAWLRAEHTGEPGVWILGVRCDVPVDVTNRRVWAPPQRFDRDRGLAGRWADLAPATRAGLATRIVLVGAESTGTTTLSRLLCEHYRARDGSWALTQCVEKFGREYTERKCGNGIAGADLRYRCVRYRDLGAPLPGIDAAVRTVDALVSLLARFGEPLHGPGFEPPVP